jgi:glycosyltransferase involved in cell wall biosynthesis
VPDLLEAYGLYRGRVETPWDLQVAGDGPLRHALARREGVLPLGFRQPAELPPLMAKAGALVLPSREEPWGVVVHEAATAGLPVICTHQCGSGAELVRSLYNGLLFEAGDVVHLAALMATLSAKGDAELAEMGRRSHELSRQFTPELWARRLLEGVRLLRRAPA